MLGSVLFALDPDPSVGAVGRPAPGVGRGVLSERDHMEHRRADVLAPRLGKRDGGWFLGCHDVFQSVLIEAEESTLTTIWAAC